MTKSKVIGIVVVAAVIIVGLFLLFGRSTPPAPAGDALGGVSGAPQNIPGNFTNGLSRGGNELTFAKQGFIPQGRNQAAWTNKTGRTVYVSPGSIRFGYLSGTASSSLLFYVATTTSTSFTDFAAPTGVAARLIDAATVPTSTPAGVASMFTGTTTPTTGIAFAIPDGSSLVFDVQEKFACKAVGSCETATSTNRGISQYFWYFDGTYFP